MAVNARDELIEGLSQLRTRGWGQGTACNPSTGQVCPLGALAYGRGVDVLTAIGNQPELPDTDDADPMDVYGATPGIHALASRIRNKSLVLSDPDDYSDIDVIWKWNDNTTRTYGEVEELFVETIESLSCTTE